ncbi:hypothetical protein CSV71_10585 [Sporosarcina sp. P21c]|uniref:hypothetical protein n=1 Tax=Sporosarcina TaxID=1569 RepID=UPI000A14B1AF|nr:MULTISPECIES: hypothetical protein [Sporosarcina]ARJ39355.1 hypothetical protein SporoP8_11010 [Sporosarcina ureae]PIC67600.1 hypothetical protein CSV78_06755 [Sporosarcina sp. P16a]PIC83599.1 hypothetical protein CSV73_06755 [Sporosarcina sp. P1]PIC89358.1 hypothetical protein CSV71_10585 [Sporosarcina sp. P21c]PIC93051.1 hypothetical protein CSV70_07505 [Sporosarcina sp. P25]
MTKDGRQEIIKKNEMRSKEISKMIGEGGIGAEKYYDIRKKTSTEYVSEEHKENESDGNK